MKICILSAPGLADEMIRHTKTVLEAVCKSSYLSLEFCHGQPEEDELQSGCLLYTSNQHTGADGKTPSIKLPPAQQILQRLSRFPPGEP